MMGKVISSVKKFDRFDMIDNRYVLETNVDEIIKKWDSFILFYPAIIKWASIEVSVDGSILYEYKDRSKLFYSIHELRRCYLDYSSTSFKEGYCNERWGCLLLTDMTFNPAYYAPFAWYNIAKYIDGKWMIDKDRIRKNLFEEIRLKRLDSCPNFDINRVELAINSLPDSIDIFNGKWEISTSARMVNGDFIELPSRIYWKVNDNSRTFKAEIEIDKENFVDNVIKNLFKDNKED